MRPRLICHMTSSVDGRALVPLWHPADAVPDGLWDTAKDRLNTDASIMGRVTGLEYAQGDAPYPETSETVERADHLPPAGLTDYRVAIDPHGSLAWGRGDIDGAPIIVAVTESTSDSYLAGLRADGVYYLFAGSEEIDLGLLLDKLGDLGIQRIRLGGGPVTSGQFLHAGLIDEISLLLVPALDGYSGAPALFEHQGERDNPPFPVSRLELTSSEVLDGGVLWLRYELDNPPR